MKGNKLRNQDRWCLHISRRLAVIRLGLQGVNGVRFSVGWDTDDHNLRRIALQSLLNIGDRLLRQAESQEHLVGTHRGGAVRAMFLTQEMLSYLYTLREMELRWFTAGDLFAC
jgi:hypothetical protein